MLPFWQFQAPGAFLTNNTIYSSVKSIMMFGKNVDINPMQCSNKLWCFLQCSTHPISKQGGIHVFFVCFFVFVFFLHKVYCWSHNDALWERTGQNLFLNLPSMHQICPFSFPQCICWGSTVYHIHQYVQKKNNNIAAFGDSNQCHHRWRGGWCHVKTLICTARITVYNKNLLARCKGVISFSGKILKVIKKILKK